MIKKTIFFLLLTSIKITFAASLVEPSKNPLETGLASAVKPNLMYTLDDSGSMSWDYLGDQINHNLCKTSTLKSVGTWSNWALKQKYSKKSECTNAASKPPKGTEYECRNSGKDLWERKLSNSENINVFSQFSRVCSTGGFVNMNTSSNYPDVFYFTFDVNKLYYNPNVVYKPAVNYDGTSFGEKNLDSVNTDVYLNPSQKEDITNIREMYFCNKEFPTSSELKDSNICKRNGVDTPNPFNYYTEAYPKDSYTYRVKGKSKPFYYKITSTEYCNSNGTICSDSINDVSKFETKVRWCSTIEYAISETIPSGAGTCQKNYGDNYKYLRVGKLERVNISSSENTNYANWYSYYRTRINAAKTTTGLSFVNLDSSKRIGFFNINANDFLEVNDFNSTQKQNFFNKLYNTKPSGGTNLKESVSAIGRYFANKKTTGVLESTFKDPLQYSCQQNFNILTTDGYWNKGTNGIDLQGNNTSSTTNYDNNNSVTTFDMRQDGAYDGNLSGSKNTLADIAMLYYKTPLRSTSLNNCISGSTGQNLCPTVPNVPISTIDKNTNIHMNFYALSFGLNGLMTYSKDYQKGGSEDFEGIKKGSINKCSWTTGTCNWPSPSGDDPEAIDDLWHATVNGRGFYFSAENPDEISSGLSESFAYISSILGSSSSSATSSPNITTSNNYLYSSTYRTAKWDGEILAKKINPKTGIIYNDIEWSAKALLANKVSLNSDTRKIKFIRNTDGVSKLVDFDYNNMNSSEKLLFDNKANNYTQYSGLNTTNKNISSDGNNLVNYLRGRGEYETNTNSTSPLYRSRDYILGDIVDSAPVFVDIPNRNWTDTDYVNFKEANKTRKKILIAAANDGMIHAFDSQSGEELWAIIPSNIMNKMHLLADENYKYNHEFFVNGNISVMDAKVKGSWKTLAIIGMGSGGSGYVALDITDTSNPSVLWELCNSGCSINDNDLGYAYSNPIITMRKFDKKWVAYLTSGYDNSSGKGFLYEIDLSNAVINRKISTGTSTAGLISKNNQVGIAKINAYIENFSSENLSNYIYAGDLNGDIWKFDLTSADGSVKLLGTAKDSLGNSQPITTKIEIGKINNNIVLFFGTGSYLNSTDQLSVSKQSLYGIKDTDDNLGNIRKNSNIVKQEISLGAGGIIANSTNNQVNFSNNNGWYFDFNSQEGERVNLDINLVLGSLNVITNVPYSSVCTAGGNSWYYQVDYKNGTAITEEDGVIGRKLYGGFSVGQIIVRLSEVGILKNYVTDALGTVSPISVSVKPKGDTLKIPKKISWKEFISK